MQASDDPTIPPSNDNSFRDPTPSSLELISPLSFREGNDTGIISDSFRYSDQRLSYANPYSR